MSGTDFTITPYLALYKPIAGADVGNWGLHWNANADVLDATLNEHADAIDAMDGAFLPLTGGVLSGPTYIVATGSTTSRSIQDRWGAQPNVRDFGAVLDGTVNDTTAWSNARAAASINGTVIVPRGRQNVLVAPTAGPATPVLWQYDGVVTGPTGTNPVTVMGTDIIENFFNGTKFYGRGNSAAATGPVLRVDGRYNHTGGTSGNTVQTLQLNHNASGTFNEAVFGFTSLAVSTKTGGGNVVALFASTDRNVGGALSGIFGANILASDKTGNRSTVSGSIVGVEFDISANDVDDGGAAIGAITDPSQGIRVVVDVVTSKNIGGGVDATMGWGVRVGSGTNCTFGRHFAATGAFSKAAISTEYAVQGASANAIWLGNDHRIALQKAGTSYLQYRVATNKLYYVVGGVDKFSIDASGNIRAAGTITGSVTP